MAGGFFGLDGTQRRVRAIVHCTSQGFVGKDDGVKLYVGNLPYSITAEELRKTFSQFGTVTDVHLPTDRETNRPRGFAFVEFATNEEGEAAIKGMDGKPIGGRPVKVNEARPREERPPGGGRGPGRGGNRW